jgi:hypothetical protein
MTPLFADARRWEKLGVLCTFGESTSLDDGHHQTLNPKP